MMHEACRECPFRRDPAAELLDRVDAGHWVPCVRTEASPIGTFDQRIAQMRAEVECFGARLWRRDKRLLTRS